MATAQPDRRKIRYQSLADVLHDAERLATGQHRTTGNWSYGQILKHLAMSADACFDGFGDINVPWWARWFIAPLVKKQFLLQTMRAGVKLPRNAIRLLPPDDASVEEGLVHFRRALARFDIEAPTAPHPFLGKLRNKEEYLLLQLRHCELHMSFVHPRLS